MVKGILIWPNILEVWIIDKISNLCYIVGWIFIYIKKLYTQVIFMHTCTKKNINTNQIFIPSNDNRTRDI